MYILYPPSKKNWGHHALTWVTLALLGLTLYFIYPAKPPSAQLPSEGISSQVEEDLNLCQKIIQRGGIKAFIWDYYQGFPDYAETFPILPLIHVSVYQKEASDFIRSQQALFVLSLIVFPLIAFWSIRRTEGEVFAFLTSSLCLLSILFHFFLGVNPHDPNARVPLEWPILGFFGYLAWFNLVQETDEEARGSTSGLWAGAAFLTGPAGAIAFIFCFLYWILQWRPLFLRRAAFWYFLLGFGAVASPMLVRDYWLHQNPLAVFMHLSSQFSLGLGSTNETVRVIFPAFLLVSLVGIMFDPNKNRKFFSVLYLVGGTFAHKSYATIGLFYCAGLLHAVGNKLFGKVFVWICLFTALATLTYFTWAACQ